MTGAKEVQYAREKSGTRLIKIFTSDGKEISKEYEFKDIPEEFKFLEDYHNDAIFARRKFEELRYDSAIVINYDKLPIDVKESLIQELEIN